MFFEQPLYLILILLIPCYFFFLQFLEKNKKEKLEKLGNPRWINALIDSPTTKTIFFQKIAYSVAIAFFSIALANPKWGEKSEELQVKQSDVVIALDISHSMLCDDVKPNRLTRAKLFCSQLVENIKAERIGIVVFAGAAYIQMPLTTDYNAALMFIQSASTDLAATQGTSISDAIKATQEMRGENKNPCSLIIVTDGETHDDDALNFAEDAQKQDVSIFVVGVGTKEGGFIPINEGSYQLTKKDEAGNPVRTRMNPKILAQLAKVGGGDFQNLQEDSNVDNLKNAILSNAADTSKKISYRNKESRYQIFLVLGFLSLLVGYFLKNIF